MPFLLPVWTCRLRSQKCKGAVLVSNWHISIVMCFRIVALRAHSPSWRWSTFNWGGLCGWRSQELVLASWIKCGAEEVLQLFQNNVRREEGKETLKLSYFPNWNWRGRIENTNCLGNEADLINLKIHSYNANDLIESLQ